MSNVIRYNTQVDFNRHNPFREPTWRYDRALELVGPDGERQRASRRDDRYVRRLRDFLCRYRAGETSDTSALRFDDEPLFWAWKLMENRATSALGMMVETRVLAGQSDQEIVEYIPTLPETIHLYEQLFFNVRDRLAMHDWIVDRVLYPIVHQPYRGFGQHRAPELAQRQTHTYRGASHEDLGPDLSDPNFDGLLYFFAYFGGPGILEVAMTGFQRGRMRTQKDFLAFIDSYIQTNMRRRVAHASNRFQLNKYNIVELLHLHNRYVEAVQGSDSREQASAEYMPAVQQFLSCVNVTFGTKAKKQFEGTVIGQADEYAVEPRSGELLQLGMGVEPSTVSQVKNMEYPEPPANEPGSGADEGQGAFS